MQSKHSRRDFIKNASLATGAGAFAAGSPLFWRTAEAAETIKVGFISPRTGPLGSFGECDPYVIELVRKALAKGLINGGKSYKVEILDRDTQSDPSRAAQLAKELINSDGIDFMLTTSTPEVVNPVSDACEAAGVPCLSTVMPWEAWYFGRGAKPGAPSPYKWTYHFSFGVKNFLDSYLSNWKSIPTNKKVGVLYPNDADGNAIRAHLIPDLKSAGYTIIDPGGYEDGTTDFSAQIAKYKSEGCEIFNTFPLPPDFATFWRQAAQQGYTKMVKIAAIAKTGLFPSSVEALGSLGDKLSGATYWHPTFPYSSSVTGLSSHALANGYESATGKQWNQQVGASMSLFDAGFAALKTSGAPKNKAAVAKALAKLKTTTIVGVIDFTKGPVPNVATSSEIGNQWIKSKPGSKYPFEMVLTENSNDRHIPITAKLLPYDQASIT